MFSVDLAKKGINQFMDTLVRDPTIGPRVKVVLVEGSTHQLLGHEQIETPRIDRYLDTFLEKEANNNDTPVSDLYHLMRDLRDDGIDPVAPIIKLAKQNIVLVGIGLFQDDRYKVKIGPDQAIYLAMLRQPFRQGGASINLGKEKGVEQLVLLNSIVGKRKVKVRRKQHSFSADITLKLKASIVEYVGDLDLSNRNVQKRLSKQIGKKIESEIEALLKLMQKNKIDNVGIGMKARNLVSYKEWTAMDWHDEFANMELNVHVDVEIKDFGTFR